MTINGGTIESSGGLKFTPTSLVLGGDVTFTKTGSSAATDTWEMPVDLTGGIRTITQNANGADRIFTGKITNGGLTKAGSGVLTLSGANDYRGKTTVEQGTLKLSGSGSIAASGEINIASGAVLDVGGIRDWTVVNGQKLSGEGTVSGAAIISGTHAPTGKQTFSGGLTYANGSIFEWSLESASISSGFDTVSVVGAMGAADGAFRVITDLTIDGTEPAGFWTARQQWESIFSVTGTKTGWAADTAVTIYDTKQALRDVRGCLKNT